MGKKFLGLVAAALFMMVFACVSTPDILLHRIRNWTKGAPDLVRRQTEMTWQYKWARRFWHMFKTIAGMEMPIYSRGDRLEGSQRIIVLNHRTAIDHLVAARVLKQVGLDDVRWVVKEQMRSAPIYGGVLERAGFAFVSRKGDPEDREGIRRMAALAALEGGSVAIYPEGTRFNGTPKSGSHFSLLNDPHLGGFQTLCGQLPDIPILVVCLDWGDIGAGGKTMWDGEAFVGRCANCMIWEEENPGAHGAQAFLIRTWSTMDEILTESLSRHQAFERRFKKRA